jgi:hypothetical protein
MPQHPQYGNSPEKNLEKLFKLLDDLMQFGMMHEDHYQSFELLMSELYPEALKAHTDAENDTDELNEPDGLDEQDYIFIPTVSTLFDYVPKDEHEQFIQDFRNVIAHCLFSNTYDIEGVADEITQMRDIDYYRMHVHVEEDTETIGRYRYKDRTVWFPSSVKPEKKGIYEISNLDYENPKHSGYAYWDSSKWHDSCILLNDCINQKRSKQTQSWQDYCWRGFIDQIN